MAEEKQYAATPNRLKKAKEKGDLPKSQAFTQAAVFASIVVIVLVGFPVIWERIAFLVQYAWSDGFREPLRVLYLFSVYGGSVLALTIGSISLLGVVLDGSQIGLLWRPSLALPNIERINLFAGLGKSLTGIKRIPLLILKIGILLTTGYFVLSDLIFNWQIISISSYQNIFFTIGIIKNLLFTLASIGLVIGVFDLLHVRRQYRQKHSMSLDEIRRENKEEEGNPEFRSRRKMLHRALISQDLIQRVRRSKVIIVSKRGAK